ncbi:uncharacterized protein K460DRAFT_406355 [Cucurbitaria berberidis CBS 394.84]|uniref:Uncharacterized protein n=1 Tax=Cucurbitaria berberidis CBS 394.84 TaxID=1168544 RepID=A0A9P4GHB3_9PLEO|nr:uncharacterized protein K460DRAFT_406355 [Cucurbitaria berberidis CBS 394.84]KAF1846133.1 hypothetical protein K460DRAFT_406355 [Cucurbitaria berberidis CBS 394.84]
MAPFHFHEGPFGGKNIFKFRATFQQTVEFSANVARTVNGTIPLVRTKLPKASIAMAMQSTFETFRREKSTLRMVDELFVSLEELTLGVSILNRQNHCICSDEHDRDTEAHDCMFCCKFKICSSMVWSGDERLMYPSHFVDGVPPHDMIVHYRVTKKAYNLEPQLPLEFLLAMRDAFLTNDWLQGTNFKDAYKGVRPEALTPNHMSLSIDAVFPLHKSNDNYYVHHAGNVCLTTVFPNYLKQDDLPIVLVAASDALKSTAPGKYLPQIELGSTIG